MKLTAKHVLPTLPKAIRLPADASLTWEDLIARDSTLRVFTETEVHVNIEEKVDGSSVAMGLLNEHPVIRTKDKVLKKGESGKTPSKKQFANIWTWFYDNRRKFKNLENQVGPCSVYGEWMLMQHGLEYNLLPDWFIAFDLYLHDRQLFLSPLLARPALVNAGFHVSNQFTTGREFRDYVDLVEGPSAFTNKDPREGIYIKLCNNEEVTHRFKMVRPGFVRGALFDDTKVVKNRIGK